MEAMATKDLWFLPQNGPGRQYMMEYEPISTVPTAGKALSIRMHRKLAVVDGRIAFVGGINFAADHLADFGPKAKQDYAVEVDGPLAVRIRGYMREALANVRTGRGWFSRASRHKDEEARNELERFFRRAGVTVTPPPVVKTVIHEPSTHSCQLTPIGDVTLHAGSPYPSPYGPEDA